MVTDEQKQRLEELRTRRAARQQGNQQSQQSSGFQRYVQKEKEISQQVMVEKEVMEEEKEKEISQQFMVEKEVMEEEKGDNSQPERKFWDRVTSGFGKKPEQGVVRQPKQRYGSKESASDEHSSPSGSGLVWNSALILFVLGVIQYILRFVGSAMPLLLSWGLFLVAGYAFAEKSGKKGIERISVFVPMLAFLVWYYYFGGNYDPRFLLIFGSVVAAVLALPVLFSRGQALPFEAAGFIPVMFLFLDVGLLPFLIDKLQLPVTPLLQNLIFFTPWWALLGLYLLPPNPTHVKFLDGVLGFVKVIGVLYIIFVLVVPAIPQVGYNDTLRIPGVDEFEAAQRQLREQLPQGEQPAISNVVCTLTQGVRVAECIKERQAKSLAQSYCENKEELTPDTPEFKTCFDEHYVQLVDPSRAIAGTEDPTIKQPTKVSFVFDPFLVPRETSADIGQLQYTATLEYKNPRKQEITADLECRFIRRTAKSDVAGTVMMPTTITFSQTEGFASVTCIPAEPLEGVYDLEVTATLRNVETRSRLTRFFISGGTPQQNAILTKRVTDIEGGSLQKYSSSQAPAEFVRLNFGLGNTVGNPIVDVNVPIYVGLSFENIGKGKIERILSYQLLPESGFNAPCLTSNGEIAVPQGRVAQKTFGVPGCRIENLPVQLQGIKSYEPLVLQASVVYDYVVSGRQQVTIHKSPSVEAPVSS